MGTYQLRRRIRRLRRRYRWRSYRSRDRLTGLAVVAAAALVVAGHAAAGHRPPPPARASTAAVLTAGGLDTRAGWARALLTAARLPVTACNLAAVQAWEHAEGGGFGNQAAGNPLNLNPGPGTAWPGHSADGAWAFPDARTGLAYTVATLTGGGYPGIVAALRRGDDARAVTDAIERSPWAASHYDDRLEATC